MEIARSLLDSRAGHWGLPVGFALIILLMFLVAALGIGRMADNTHRIETAVTRHNNKINLTVEMYTLARERSMTLLSMVTMDDPFDREDRRDYYVDLGGKFAATRAAFVETGLTDQEAVLLDRQGELSRTIVPLQDRVIELMDGDDLDAAIGLLLEEGIPAQDEALAQLTQIVDHQYALAREALNEANEYVRGTALFMSLLAGVAIGVSTVIAVIVIGKARRDERSLLEAKDNLEVRVQERTRELSRAYADIEMKNRSLESLSSKLSKYLSPQVYASIFSGKRDVKVASERKKLTVFFSDIAGFTEAADRMESEDLTQLINFYLAEMSRVALDYGATVDKYIGDAIMIFFGDPESRGVKEDALACVKMAIAMQKRMLNLEPRWHEFGFDTPLSCRMGIHTGFCTVGNFGSEERMDYTIIGTAVNLASRLEHEAPEGGILISIDTHAHVKEHVVCKERGRIKVRGIYYPITTFLVAAPVENVDHAGRTVRSELPHLKLEADFHSMSPKEREDAAAALREALTQASPPAPDPSSDSKPVKGD